MPSSFPPAAARAPHARTYQVAGAVLEAAPLAAGLYVVATPIGNLGDISLRALSCLAAADLVLCEDTRVTRRLLAAYGIKTKLSVYQEHNATRVRPVILERLAAGAAVVLVSDAGTPLVSDPGFKLVTQARAAGHAIFPVPGASAALAGLVASGLPSDRFFFEGFLPSKPGARKNRLAALKHVPGTLVIYESPKRLAATLADMADAFGAREAAVARELTKKFEETRTGPLAALAAHYKDSGAPKGEIVICVAPPAGRTAVSEEEVDALLADFLGTMSVRDAADRTAKEASIPRKQAYARALKLAKGGT